SLGQGFGRTAASCSQTENRVPKKQKLFQEDSGIPVHPEHGIMDALVYPGAAQLLLTGRGRPGGRANHLRTAPPRAAAGAVPRQPP
uniref:Cytochrome c oxidase subunit 7A2, mitochondrial n=1 Tax=Anser cygnoides TaxID=8845 RepID=A0A8B9D2Z4_ANSCY